MSADNFELLRREMVETQIKRRGIKSQPVLDALLEVKRHLFVPEEYRSKAYDDKPLPIGYGQTISQPFMVASMTEKLNLSPQMKVLEIGTGSGYQTAALAHIGAEIFTVERIKPLHDRTKKLLAELGYNNVHCLFADGGEGFGNEEGFDRILITAAAKVFPQKLADLLVEGGRLVMPLGGSAVQTLISSDRIDGKDKITKYFDCIFVPLLKGAESFEQ